MVRFISTLVSAFALMVGAELLSAPSISATPERALIGRYSTPEMAATYPVPLPAEGDVICTGQPIGPRLAEKIAWQEIGELRNLGLPVCDVTWQFADFTDPTWWGWAEPTEAGATITIEVDLSEYAEEADRDLAIRSIVRHEFGHALIYAAGYVYGTGDLDVMFDDALSWSVTNTDRGHEAAAEAVALVLAQRRGDERRALYVSHVSPESIVAATAIVASITE